LNFAGDNILATSTDVFVDEEAMSEAQRLLSQFGLDELPPGFEKQNLPGFGKDGKEKKQKEEEFEGPVADLDFGPAAGFIEPEVILGDGSLA
jgi:hypothetical protein